MKTTAILQEACLGEAANLLYTDYKTDTDLTPFTQLGGEDFYDASGSISLQEISKCLSHR
jgi:hypothetical protein